MSKRNCVMFRKSVFRNIIMCTLYLLPRILTAWICCFLLFQELLTRNKSASAEFLEANYDKFFSHYQSLLSSDNYVTRRQALKVSSHRELVNYDCCGNMLRGLCHK